MAVVSLYAPEREAFTDDHGRLVQMIAPHIAQAINAAQLRAEPSVAHAGRDFRIVASR